MLGDGVDWQKPGQLGPLHFSAVLPTLEDETLFPAPAHLLRDGSGRLYRLAPGRRAFSCDLGPRVHLSAVTGTPSGADALKPLGDAWLGASAMADVLAGRHLGHDVSVPSSALWSREPRVGIGLDSAARTALEGQLYADGHVRPRPGVGLRVAVAGLDVEAQPGLGAIGGDHRMAEIMLRRGRIDLPTGGDISGGRYLVIALSPFLLPQAPMPGGTVDGLPGTVISACLGRAVRIGGWDGRTRRSIPMRQALPAGSVLFMQAGEGDAVAPLNGSHVGEATTWGFGQIVVGRWDWAEE